MYGQYGGPQPFGAPQQAPMQYPQAFPAQQGFYPPGNAMPGPSIHAQPFPQMQVPYGGQGPQMMAPPQPHLPTQLDINTDPAVFDRVFREHLATLTFNSKQIITMLTIMADDHKSRMSALIARSLDSHITSSPPSYRLPALYLLDSICKNIGYPYSVLWAPHITRIFMDSYRVVDPPVKAKLEDLLATWRDSGSNGEPLFGADTQAQLEHALYGPDGARQQQQLVRPPVADSQQQSHIHNLLRRIDAQLASGSQEQYHRPDDLALVSRLEALRGLRQVVQAGTLAPTDLQQIDAQLTTMEQASRATQQVAPTAAPATGGLPAGLAASLGALNGGADAAPGSVASDLFSKLMASGLLGSVTAAQEPEQDDEYTKMMGGLSISLTVHELQRDVAPTLIDEVLLLRRYLPAQCRQCARRFPTTEKGQKSKEEHLDWHFKQNKRVKDSIARGQSRLWFPKLAEFIRGGFDDSPPSTEAAGGTENDSAGGASLTAQQDKALKAKFANKYVIAPTDPIVSAQPCPICKESFKSVYNEDEEEWVWYDAMQVNGTYYHASCHHSAETLTASVKREGTPSDTGVKNRSRESTPAVKEEKPAAVLDPVARVKEEAGVSSPKRKREELDNAAPEPDVSASPPAKKAALEMEGEAPA